MVIKLKKLLITLAVTMHGPLTAGAAQAEQVQVMASGLDHPWSLAFLPAGDVLVTERAGRLWRLGTGGQKLTQ